MTEAKVTQNYKLAELLGKGEPVTKKAIADLLGVSEVSVAVYIYDLRKKFKAQIQNVTEPLPPGSRGRGKVVAYRLINKINVPKYRSNNVIVETSTDGEPADPTGIVPVLDQDAGAIGEREMADIADSLGVSAGGSFGE